MIFPICCLWIQYLHATSKWFHVPNSGFWLLSLLTGNMYLLQASVDPRCPRSCTGSKQIWGMTIHFASLTFHPFEGIAYKQHQTTLELQQVIGVPARFDLWAPWAPSAQVLYGHECGHQRIQWTSFEDARGRRTRRPSFSAMTWCDMLHVDVAQGVHHEVTNGCVWGHLP